MTTSTTQPPSPPAPSDPHVAPTAATRVSLHQSSSVAGRLRFARAYLSALDSAERRERLLRWALKPGLLRRATGFVFPQFKKPPSATLDHMSIARSDPRHRIDVDSWEAAREQNLCEIVALLDRANIEHVVVDDQNRARSQVGIEQRDKERLIAAFVDRADRGCVLAANAWGDQVQLEAGARSDRRYGLRRRRVALSDSFLFCHDAQLRGTNRSFGLDYATVVSLWTELERTADQITVGTSCPNRWGELLTVGAERHDELGTLGVVRAELSERTHVADVDFPIDLVCMWVDGDDPAWVERRDRRLRSLHQHADVDVTDEAVDTRLFRTRDELRYALRSIDVWAPFIRHVYLVTDDQTPDWLDRSAPGLTVVDHRDILPADALPTFNSNAIDTGLHRIPGLTEHFLVTNDDMLFIGEVMAEDFFEANGAPRLFMSRVRIPMGDPVRDQPAVDAAARMNRDLIQQRHGRAVTQKFKHIMIPQRVSIRRRLEDAYAEHVDRTARHPFRDQHDLAFSHLCLYEALVTGEGLIGTLPYDYVSLGSSTMPAQLDRARRNADGSKVLCLNDSDVEVVRDDFGRPVVEIEVDATDRDRQVIEFLDEILPNASRWERTDTSGSTGDPRARPIIEETTP